MVAYPAAEIGKNEREHSAGVRLAEGGEGKSIATAPAKKAWKLILFAVEERRLGAVSGIMGLPLVFLILKGSVFL